MTFFFRCNLGHVSRSQMRQVLITNGILLSDEEFYALEKRYNDDMGFNYLWFLSEADPKDYIPLKVWINFLFLFKFKIKTSFKYHEIV